MNKQSDYGLEQEIQSSALVRGASTYYFLSDSEDGYKVISDFYMFSLIKSSILFLRAPSSLYTTFLIHLHTRASQICRYWSLSHQPSPKALR